MDGMKRSREARGISPLGYALLGLLRSQPRSGYALRMVFETTPMGVYSSSPGSIYPALKSLTAAGLVEQSADARGKQVYQLTNKGGEALRSWLRAPVEEADAAQGVDQLLLRFAFLQDERDPELTDSFLKAFEAATSARAASIEAFLANEPGLTFDSRLALEHGVRSVRASADWAADARARLRHNQ